MAALSVPELFRLPGRFPLIGDISPDLDPDTLVMVLFSMGPETDDLDIISGAGGRKLRELKEKLPSTDQTLKR